MAHAESSATIARPIAEVFAVLADGTKDPQWRRGILEIRRVGGDGGMGTTYRQVLSGPGGRRIDGDYRVTTYSPPYLYGFTVIAGPLRPTGTFALSEGPTGTVVRFELR